MPLTYMPRQEGWCSVACGWLLASCTWQTCKHVVHSQELEQRQQRLRNLKAELQNLQRLEVVHLENFLDGQARAGKQMPLEERGFKRDGMDYEYDLVGI